MRYVCLIGLNNSSNLGNTTTSQYNSYSSASNHKLGKDSGYDNSSNTVSNTQTTTSSNVTSTTALSLSQTTVSVTKSTTTLGSCSSVRYFKEETCFSFTAAKNSSSVVSNIPPGVAPVMSTPYIMGQVPYFQPPQVYSYEEMQLLQQRLPHMVCIMGFIINPPIACVCTMCGNISFTSMWIWIHNRFGFWWEGLLGLVLILLRDVTLVRLVFVLKTRKIFELTWSYRWWTN